MLKIKSRHPSLLRLRGVRGLFGALGLFGLCGPIVGCGAVVLVGLIADRHVLGDFNELVLLLPILAYAAGLLPALVTGAAAGLVPFDGSRRFLVWCTAAGFVAGGLEMFVFLLLVGSGFADGVFVTAIGSLVPVVLTGGAGAAAGLVCGALLRRLFRNAARPPTTAEVFG